MTSRTIPNTNDEQTNAASRRTVSSVWVWIVVGYVVLIAMAGLARAVTYERYLPVFEHIDESYRFIHAYQLREDAPLGEAYGQIEWAEGFPPLQPWVAIWSQRWVESRMPFPYPPDYVRALRIFSAVANVGTTLLIALTGTRLARRLGPGMAGWVGLLAALPWAVGPRVVGTGNLALMDPLIFPAVAAALFFAVVSIQEDSAPAAFGSLLAVIAAIYLKYLLVYALWLPFCAVAVLVWRRRWKAIPWIFAMGLVSVGTAGWLVFVHDALALDNRESEAFYENGLANMLSPSRNLDNIAYTLQESVGLWLFIGVLVTGVVAYIISARRGWRTVDWRWLAVLLPYMLVNMMLTSSVDILRTWEPYWFRVRYTLPSAAGFMLIWALCAAQVVLVLSETRLRRWRGWVPAALALLVTVPAGLTIYNNARAWAQPHTYERIWEWADPTLPDDGAFIMAERSDIHSVWNRPWSGYNGVTGFRWEFTDEPYGKTPTQWDADGFAYFAASEADMGRHFDNPAMEPWLETLYPIKTIPGGVDVETPVTFWRFLPPDVQTDVSFGDAIVLTGYDINTTTLTGGDVLTLRPYWQATEKPAANYSMFIHLLPPDETTPLVQFDGPPASERRLPVTWDDPLEVLVGTEAALPLPVDLPPGDYTLAVGLYDFNTGVRLQTSDGADAYRISVQVE